MQWTNKVFFKSQHVTWKDVLYHRTKHIRTFEKQKHFIFLARIIVNSSFPGQAVLFVPRDRSQ